MKRSLTIFALLVLGMVYTSSAQNDDVYYDPSIDQGAQNKPADYDSPPADQQTTENNYVPPAADKSDGYGSPADKYDPRDNYATDEYSTDAGYYDEDYDSYFYTTRLRRYYTPNYGTNYYSYWFTPSYYVGFSTWNTGYVVSYSPWYRDPWWGWNRRPVATVVVYDPFWDWNFGWNSCAYYSSWSNPYWGYNSCNYYGGYSNWGYNGWGCHNGGYYGGGYNNGYYNGYNNGYWNGYYNGYNDGYNSSAYNNGYYYYGPRHHRNGQPSGTGNPGGGTTTTPVDNPVGGNIYTTNIPREGIQKPFPSAQSSNQGGIKVEAGKDKPYVAPNTTNSTTQKPVVAARPQENTNLPNNNTRRDTKVNTYNGGTVNMPSSNTNTTPGRTESNTNTVPTQKPVVKSNTENEEWHTAPPDRWSNGQPARQPAQGTWNQSGRNTPQYSNPAPLQDATPRPRVENNGGQRNVQPQNVEPQRVNPQPRPQAEPNRNLNRTEPRQVQPQQPAQQPRQYNQQNFNRAEPRTYQQPQQQPQRNFSPPQQPQQRNISPAPQNNGGMRRGKF